MRLIKRLAGSTVDFLPAPLDKYVSNTYYYRASKEAGTEPEKPMITIATLAYLALLSNTAREALNTPRGRALAMFEAAKRRDGVKWYANDALVVLRGNDADGYSVTVDGAPINIGPFESTISTVKCLVVGLDEPLRPTPTARAYTQFAFWADVQNGYLMSYVMFSDGGWDEDPAAIEFACPHMLEHVNADFGTSFTMDDFQEGDDCSCAI